LNNSEFGLIKNLKGYIRYNTNTSPLLLLLSSIYVGVLFLYESSFLYEVTLIGVLIIVELIIVFIYCMKLLEEATTPRRELYVYLILFLVWLSSLYVQDRWIYLSLKYPFLLVETLLYTGVPVYIIKVGTYYTKHSVRK